MHKPLPQSYIYYVVAQQYIPVYKCIFHCRTATHAMLPHNFTFLHIPHCHTVIHTLLSHNYSFLHISRFHTAPHTMVPHIPTHTTLPHMQLHITLSQISVYLAPLHVDRSTQFATVKWTIYISNISNTLLLFPDSILSGE